MKKYVAEMIGTAGLVFIGCGAAILHGLPNAAGEGCGYLGIAIAFGLGLIAMAYSIGNISGCHINPAVSLAMFIRGKLTSADFAGYVIGQFLGGILGALLLYLLVGTHPELGVATGGFGCNGYGAASNAGLSATMAFVAEIILTFCFVLTIIGVTSKPETASIAGLIIGITLIGIHIVGIPLTGTSVNPARSFGPALIKGGEALAQVWVFIIAPLVGGALAAFASPLAVAEVAKEDKLEEE